MNTIQFVPTAKEKPFETVNRALKNAQLYNKTVTLKMFGECYPIKPTDTHEDVTALKSLLHTRSQLELVSDKLSAKI
jgi:hypothetical protein